jgi:hypothetical protein
MRYYDLTITNLSGVVLSLSSSGLGLVTGGDTTTFSSLYTAYQTSKNSPLVGTTNPGALQIEFDVPVVAYDTPQGQAWIRITGIGIQTLNQASNLNPVGGKFCTFALRGGMAQGLPLASATLPRQPGLLVQGNIFQAFGNWQGTEQTLDLICAPGNLTPITTVNWTWQKGQTIGDSITTTLNQAFSGYKQDVQTSSTIVAPNNYSQPGSYPDFWTWASDVQTQSYSVGKTQPGKYPGVFLSTDGATISAYDGTVASGTTLIAFQDLIGQPTWMAANQVSFKTVLRHDLTVGDVVTFPTGLAPPYVLTQQSAAAPGAPASARSTFQGGSFLIQEVHHTGNFRDASADSWCTAFVATAIGPST